MVKFHYVVVKYSFGNFVRSHFLPKTIKLPHTISRQREPKDSETNLPDLEISTLSRQ